MAHIMELKKIKRILMTNCLITGKKNLKKVIDLGVHSYADTFIKKEQLKLSEPIYPLQCFLNSSLGLIQSGIITNAKERYNLYDYSYTSSNSKFAKDHWENFNRDVCSKINLKSNSKVLEIGSNDGFLLNKFKKQNMNVLGLDASKQMAKLANKRGVKSLNFIFGHKSSNYIKNKFGQFNLIIANNVFNHSNDPLNFIKSVKNLLNKNGTFVFEVPYWYSSMKTKKFDQIYHEHVTYFTVKFVKKLSTIVNLNILDIEIVDYHGGSLRVYLQKKKIKNKINIKLNKMITEEKKFGLFKLSFYKTFMEQINKDKLNLLKKIIDLKIKGYHIVGVGAAAKGNTFLNFHKLNFSLIDCITDSSYFKINKFTPLSRIPIFSDNILKNKKNTYILFLSWNIKKALKDKLLLINKNLKFI